jgi:hypothetical protein
MHRRLAPFERRLARLAGVLRAWSRDPETEHRERARREAIAGLLRAGLVRAGVDPDEAAALRHLEDPNWPSPFRRPPAFVNPLRRLAERTRPRSLVELLCEASRRYQQSRPDLREASPLQLIGYYCFGDGAALRYRGSGNPAASDAPAAPGPSPDGRPVPAVPGIAGATT